MKTQFLKTNPIDAIAPLVLVLVLTIGSVLSGCSPQVRTNDSNSSAGVGSNADAQYLASNGRSFTMDGPNGVAVFPSSGLLTGVDNRLKIVVGLGEFTTASDTGFAPPYTCAGYRVRLERVMADGSHSEVTSHDASPIAMKTGSAYCNSLAQASLPGATMATQSLVIEYDSSVLVRLPNVVGYRVVLFAPVNDFKRTDCVQSCATSFNCGGWATTFTGTPEQRCAGYPIQPLYSTHRLEGRIAAQIN